MQFINNLFIVIISIQLSFHNIVLASETSPSPTPTSPPSHCDITQSGCDPSKACQRNGSYDKACMLNLANNIGSRSDTD